MKLIYFMERDRDQVLYLFDPLADPEAVVKKTFLWAEMLPCPQINVLKSQIQYS